MLSDKEVIKEAIKITVNRGFKTSLANKDIDIEIDSKCPNIIWIYALPRDDVHTSISRYSLRDLLFNHKFAKLFFGTQSRNFDMERKLLEAKFFGFISHVTIDKKGQWLSDISEYQFHLQQLAMQEDLVDYIRRYLSK